MISSDLGNSSDDVSRIDTFMQLTSRTQKGWKKDKETIQEMMEDVNKLYSQPSDIIVTLDLTPGEQTV